MSTNDTTRAHSRGQQRGWTAARDGETGTVFGNAILTAGDLYPDSDRLQEACRDGFEEGWQNFHNGYWSDGQPRTDDPGATARQLIGERE